VLRGVLVDDGSGYLEGGKRRPRQLYCRPVEMQIRARRFVVYAVTAALAVANAFAPHAHAAPQHVLLTSSSADHHQGAAGNHSHGEVAVEQPVIPCHGDDPATDSATKHNCCVGSCTAVGFIVARYMALPDADYSASITPVLIAATPNTADPPPR
jgi:hypothetical protein